eukprot:g15154.t1
MARLLQPLSELQLKRLADHRYRAAGRSLLEPALQTYWAWLLEIVPTWVAPNTITLLGLVCNLLSCLLLATYCPRGTEQVRAGLGGEREHGTVSSRPLGLIPVRSRPLGLIPVSRSDPGEIPAPGSDPG